jgi:hypothetical protein
MTQAAPTNANRTRELVPTADGRIEVIVEGAGAPIVLLPSRGRDSEDYDAVAQGLAQAGFRVLRPAEGHGRGDRDPDARAVAAG